jgi:hypothetical protein
MDRRMEILYILRKFLGCTAVTPESVEDLRTMLGGLATVEREGDYYAVHEL